jgi:hypothetical protein
MTGLSRPRRFPSVRTWIAWTIPLSALAAGAFAQLPPAGSPGVPSSAPAAASVANGDSWHVAQYNWATFNPLPPLGTPQTAEEVRQAGLAEFKINQRLLAYSRDLRLALVHNGAPDLVLRHFDPKAADWFRLVYSDLADLNDSYPKSGPSGSQRDQKAAALDALCRYGPPLIEHRQVGIFVRGRRAVVTLQERGETYHMLLHRLDNGDWVFSYFFFSEIMIWTPLLIREKELRGESLLAYERDFKTRRPRIEEDFRLDFASLCASAGAPVPPQFAR